MPINQLRDLSADNESLKKELQAARRRLKNKKGNHFDGTHWLSAVNDAPQEEEETWFSTYLDMMTLLLVLMLVMLAFAGASDNGSGSGGGFKVNIMQGQGAGGEGVLPGAKQLADDSGVFTGSIADGAQGALFEDGPLVSEQNAWAGVDFSHLGDDIDVILEDESVSFRINSEILFASAQADLSLAGLAVLKKLLPVFQDNEFMITVEGHTDSVPIRSARFPSNWELSGARAGSVVRYLEANGIHSERLRAVGYADTRPLGSNDTVQGRASNRRVELTIGIDADAPLPSFD